MRLSYASRFRGICIVDGKRIRRPEHTVAIEARSALGNHLARSPNLEGMMIRILVWSLIAVIIATPDCSARDWLSLWKRYSAGFLDNQIRVIDHDASDRTTSEGQAYAMFFSLVANDRPRFDALLHWAETNLASGDLTTHLPAWSWGKGSSGKWAVLDSNSAADADVWMAYTLLEAGKAWGDAHYTSLGTSLARRIAAEEVVQIPVLGTMLLPGARGFQHGDVYRLNPSYLPLQLFTRLGNELPDGPWQQIAGQIPELIRSSSSHGFAADWVEFKSGAGFVHRSPGSYDAIRVYLWAGMLDRTTPAQGGLLEALSGMARYLKTNAVPPSEIKPDGTVVNAKSPVGFSAALLPYLSALNEKALESQQSSRVESEFNQSGGLYGNPAKYYDENLILFALGWKQRQFWFDSDGALKTAWKKD
jgi:endoglucanase